MIIRPKKQRPGAVAMLTILGIMVVTMIVMISVSTAATKNFQSTTTSTASAATFAAAEAGIQQALYALGQDSSFGPVCPLKQNYPNMLIGAVSVDTSVCTDNGKKKIVAVASGSNQTIRTIAINAYPTSFGGFRGAIQTGAGGGGLEILNGARITGNVYANGPITGKQAEFFEDVKISQLFDYDVKNGIIHGNLTAYNVLNNSIIESKATYHHIVPATTVHGGSCTDSSNTDYCSASLVAPGLPDEPYPIPFDYYRPDDPLTPIVEGTLYNQAKLGGAVVDCTSGCTLTNPPVTPLNPNPSFGPKIYKGRVTLSGNVTLGGTIWITKDDFGNGGTITVNGGTHLNLLSSYGINSEAIVAEEKIDMGTNIDIAGSGNSQSFILIVSLSSALGETTNAAINVWCNAGAAIFFAPNGSLYQKNNLSLNNSTAKTVILKENNTIIYDDKLAYINIPGGIQKVMVPEANSWQEQ